MEYLDYRTAMASGWPIATGVIEGACRQLVKDRLDITGARWGLAGAESRTQASRPGRATATSTTTGRGTSSRSNQRVHRSRYRDDYALAA